MEDMISRQALCEYALNQKDKSITPNDIMRFPSAQPEKRTEERTETHGVCLDTISRQAVIEINRSYHGQMPNEVNHRIWKEINELPSAQPTLYGYNIEHLELIARVLQKEDLPPERVVEVLTDVGRIVAIVKDEFEEALRKAVEQCMT